MLIAYNASDVTIITNAITKEQEQKVEKQNLQIIVQSEPRTEKNNIESPGVFKATSENAAKRWKIRPKTYVTTRAGKLAEATIKQIGIPKSQAEKKKMQK